MLGMTGVADSGRGADVDPRRPTSSLERDHLSPKNLSFSIDHHLHMLAGLSRHWFH
jgi:hypothetical protein